jgi:hypothetical protein
MKLKIKANPKVTQNIGNAYVQAARHCSSELKDILCTYIHE